MDFPKCVKIVEVGPRDGLQNEPTHIPTQTKIELISLLSTTGLKTIEITSFVSPQLIPQFSDAEVLLENLLQAPDISYPVLVPNITGFERALAAGAKSISVVCSASEIFLQKNTRSTIQESLNQIKSICQHAAQQSIPVRAYISCCLGCPFEGSVSLDRVTKVASELIESGCYEVSLADTIGCGTPHQAQNLIASLARSIPTEQLAIHFHDTYGQALANIYACLQLGVKTIDSSITGLGGCPVAPGATGNVATEDVVYLLDGLEIDTGVNLEALLEISSFVERFTQRPLASKAAKALLQNAKR